MQVQDNLLSPLVDGYTFSISLSTHARHSLLHHKAMLGVTEQAEAWFLGHRSLVLGSGRAKLLLVFFLCRGIIPSMDLKPKS